MLYFILNLLKYMKYISLIGHYLSDVPEACIQISAEKSRRSTSENRRACSDWVLRMETSFTNGYHCAK